MRGAIALGLRLAGAGAGPAKLRTTLMALATCVGTVLMLVVAAIASAEQISQATMYADSAELRRLLYAVVLTVSLPILALVATAGRLSAGLRERRLANLRLLGLSPLQARAVAVSEAAVSALVGVLIGAVLFQPVRGVLAALHPAGRHWSYATLTPTPLWYAVICVAVLLAVIAVAVLPQRIRMSAALARARRADHRRPSWLRVLPLLAGIIICLQQLARSGRSDTDVYWVLFVGVPLLGIGLLLVVPMLVRRRRSAAVLDRSGRHDRRSPHAGPAGGREPRGQRAADRALRGHRRAWCRRRLRERDRSGDAPADRATTRRAGGHHQERDHRDRSRRAGAGSAAGGRAPVPGHLVPKVRMYGRDRRHLRPAARGRPGLAWLCRQHADVAGS